MVCDLNIVSNIFVDNNPDEFTVTVTVKNYPRDSCLVYSVIITGNISSIFYDCVYRRQQCCGILKVPEDQFTKSSQVMLCNTFKDEMAIFHRKLGEMSKIVRKDIACIAYSISKRLVTATIKARI